MDKEKPGARTDGRVKVFWKLVLDVVVISMIIWSFYVENLQFAVDYTFSAFEVRFRFLFHQLPAYSVVSYSVFREQHCETPEDSAVFVCEWLSVFRIAGLCYFIVCLFVLLITACNLVHEVGLMLYCSCAAMQRWKFLHYTMPFFYLIAVLLFALISNIFFLQAPAGKDASYAGYPLRGFWLMGGVLGLSLLSALYFLIIGKDVSVLEAGSSSQYQALIAKALEVKPVAKVQA